MSTTATKPRKTDLATVLAATMPSVFFGEQTERYWYNAFMRDTLATLVRQYDRRLDSVTGPELGGIWTAWQDWAMEKMA
jgi:hypothetical protein